MTSTIHDAIVLLIDARDGEVRGTEELALALNAPKNWVIKRVRIAQANGELRIIQSRGGRGNKTIYKRNRNQPGLARKTP